MLAGREGGGREKKMEVGGRMEGDEGAGISIYPREERERKSSKHDSSNPGHASLAEQTFLLRLTLASFFHANRPFLKETHQKNSHNHSSSYHSPSLTMRYVE